MVTTTAMLSVALRFFGDHLLCARVRPADQDGAAGAVDELRRIVGQIR
jgi:hypothetical protein